jgi:hypothetical protein
MAPTAAHAATHFTVDTSFPKPEARLTTSATSAAAAASERHSDRGRTRRTTKAATPMQNAMRRKPFGPSRSAGIGSNAAVATAIPAIAGPSRSGDSLASDTPRSCPTRRSAQDRHLCAANSPPRGHRLPLRFRPSLVWRQKGDSSSNERRVREAVQHWRAEPHTQPPRGFCQVAPQAVPDGHVVPSVDSHPVIMVRAARGGTSGYPRRPRNIHRVSRDRRSHRPTAQSGSGNSIQSGACPVRQYEQRSPSAVGVHMAIDSLIGLPHFAQWSVATAYQPPTRERHVCATGRCPARSQPR